MENRDTWRIEMHREYRYIDNRDICRLEIYGELRYMENRYIYIYIYMENRDT